MTISEDVGVLQLAVWVRGCFQQGPQIKGEGNISRLKETEGLTLSRVLLVSTRVKFDTGVCLDSGLSNVHFLSP